MILCCIEDGCCHTMHKQCLYKFENDIGCDKDKGKVADTFYCPRHHTKKDFMESLIDYPIDQSLSEGNNCVGDTWGGKKDTQICS